MTMHDVTLLEHVGATYIPVETVRRGIYFLMQLRKIVYIGKSEDYLRRLGQHLEGKSFDRVYFFPIEYPNIIAYEAAFIRVFRPHYNHEREKERVDIADAQMIRRVFTRDQWEIFEPVVIEKIAGTLKIDSGEVRKKLAQMDTFAATFSTI